MHVIDSLARGGAERMLVEIANRSIKEGYKVSVCVTRSGSSFADELRQEIKLFFLNRSKRFEIRPMQEFASLLKEEKVDLLHAHGRTTYSFVAFLRTLGLIKQPIIFHDHLPLERGPEVPLWFRTFGRRCVNHYVGVYPELENWACSAGIPSQKIHTIENGLNLSRLEAAPTVSIRHDFGIQDNSPVGIFVGRLDSQKGIDLLLEAISKSQKGRNARVLIFGRDADSKYSQACRAQSISLNLDKSVSFVGELANVSGLLGGADFALLSSRYESGPLVLIEYMASGLPFVATKVGGIAHRAAALGVPGFVPPDNAAAFAEALDQLLNLSTEERRTRGEIGRVVAAQHFNIDDAMPRWAEIYRSATSNNSQ